MTPVFAFGTELGDADGDRERAVLADHAWMWSEHGRPVAVPVPGRAVHGVLLEPATMRRGLARVTVQTASGAVTALADVVADAEPAAPELAALDQIVAAARRLGLPDEWVEYVESWRRAGADDIARDPDRSHPAEVTSLTELLACPGVDEHVELRSAFGFLAIHGGDLEQMTDAVAASAAELAGASYYGVVHPVGFTAHLPSARFDPTESASLAAFCDHVDVAVAIHGYGRRGRWCDLLVGGRNRALAGHVAAVVGPALPGYRLVTDLADIPAELRGVNPDNPVNRPRHGGAQIELPPRVRGLSPLSPPAGPDGLSPPTRALIDHLAAAAETWSSASALNT